MRATTALLMLVIGAAGCDKLGAIAYYLQPKQIQDAEFTFPSDSTVVMLFDRDSGVDPMPVFEHQLFEATARYFRKYESKARLLPLTQVNNLRRVKGTEFNRMPLQTIGRELNADYVLHIRVVSFAAREEPDHPLLSPRVSLRTKVIASDYPASDARAWPENESGYEVVHSRATSEYRGPDSTDAEIAKLARETAYYVTLPFFDVDLEENPPVER